MKSLSLGCTFLSLSFLLLAGPVACSAGVDDSGGTGGAGGANNVNGAGANNAGDGSGASTGGANAGDGTGAAANSTGGATDPGGTGGAVMSGSGGTATGGTDGTGGGDVAGTGGTPGGGTGADTCAPGGNGYEKMEGYVVDKATCLFYQTVATPVEKLSQANAMAACEALSLGGFDDWRIPTPEELLAINIPKQQPATDAAFFPNTDFSYYWTDKQVSGKAVVVDFNWTGGEHKVGPDGAQAYRCVRKSL